MNREKYILDNGLTVLLYSHARVPKVALNMFVNVGSKDEQDGERGKAHLLEHMLFKGSINLAELDITTIVDKLAGSCNASTSYDVTSYQFEFPSHQWIVGIELFAQMLNECTFKPMLLQSEVEAVTQELKLYNDDYETLLFERMISLIFADHPYHYPILGTEHNLYAITQENLLSFYKEHYVPNNAVLVIVGDFDISTVRATIKKVFGNIPRSRSHKKHARYFNKDLQTTHLTLHKDIEQPLASCAFLIPGQLRRKDGLAETFNWIVAQGRSSRLAQQLADNLQLVSDVRADTAGLFDHDLLFIDFEPYDTQDVKTINSVIVDTLSDLAHKGPREDELVRAYENRAMEFARGMENNQAIAYAWGNSFLATDDEHYFFNEPVRYDAASVRDYCAQFFKKSSMHTGIIQGIPEEDKQYWAAYHARDDAQPSHVRSTPLEHCSYAHTVTAIMPPALRVPSVCRQTLSNGAELYWVHQDTSSLLELRFEFATTYLDDPRDKEGLACYAFTMLLEGTDHYNAHALHNALEQRGIDVHVGAGEIVVSLLPHHLEFALNLVADMVMHATFGVDALERVRKKTISAIKEYWDEPRDFIDTLLRTAVYQHHPYGNNPWGTMQSVKTITRADLIDFYRNHIIPAGTKIAVVGNLTGYEVPQVFEHALASWRSNNVVDHAFPPLEKPSATTAIKKMNREQVVLGLAGLTVSRLHPDYTALRIFDHILMGGSQQSMGAKLFLIREQTGLFYSIEGSLVDGADKKPGMFYVVTTTSPQHVDTVRKLIVSTMFELPNKVAEQEFENAKLIIMNEIMNNFETAATTAHTLLFLADLGLKPAYYEQWVAELQHVSFDDAKQAYARHIQKEHMVEIRVGPVKN